MLPFFQTDDRTLSQLQTRWRQELNPLLALPLNQGIILENVALANGSTQVNHLLGRRLNGWILTRVRASATIYDTQDANKTPATTLTLVSNAVVTVDLFVF